MIAGASRQVNISRNGTESRNATSLRPSRRVFPGAARAFCEVHTEVPYITRRVLSTHSSRSRDSNSGQDRHGNAHRYIRVYGAASAKRIHLHERVGAAACAPRRGKWQNKYSVISPERYIVLPASLPRGRYLFECTLHMKTPF